VGSVLSATAAQALSERLTSSLFGIPQSEALEKAYNYFGVNMNSSNSEINASFRALCLKHHPDKGGSTEEFHFVQTNMAIIKAHQNDL